MLATNDFLELFLRRLASYVYLTRTGDKTGAMQMLGAVPPGTQADIAPGWMVNEASSYSRAEWKRNQQTGNQQKQNQRGGFWGKKPWWKKKKDTKGGGQEDGGGDGKQQN